MSGGLTAAAVAAKGLNEAVQITGASLVEIVARYLKPGGPPPYAIGVELSAVHWARREGQVRGVFPIQVTVRRPVSDSELEDLAEITVAYQCVYNFLRDPGETDLAAIPSFLSTVGWSHAWPYLRAEVQSISSRLGLPAVILPMLLPGQAEQVPVFVLDESTSEGQTDAKQ